MDPLFSNRKFIDIDTLETVDKYIDEICSDPDFLCKNNENIEMCGKNTTIYSNVDNVKNICEEIKQANVCENDIKECIVLANNYTFEDSRQFVTTSFSNIIIPITKAFDNDGNQKFIRLPSLSSTKKKNSNEICSVCACMDRFAKSPGAGAKDGYTSPRQNTCTYDDDFEYYYYPLYVDQIRDGIKNTPSVLVGPNGKYTVLNKNIIHIKTESDLNSVNLYNILVKNGIANGVAKNFINNLYKNNEQSLKELELYLLGKDKAGNKSTFGKSVFGKSVFGKSVNSNLNSNLSFYFIIAIVLFVIYILMKNN
jgi:hypothetical protein